MAEKMALLSKVIDFEHMQNIVKEFNRLGDKCYLENAGATLYPQCLLQKVMDDLMKNVYMNPHTDKYSRDCVEQMRTMVLRHFNTDPSKYTVIFTSGTTQALKLVVESFQFNNNDADIDSRCGSFVYLRDNHTSVLGLREIASEKNAEVVHISHDEYLNIFENVSYNSLHRKDKYKKEGNSLLVYPAQSNFNGFKYPIDCIDLIKRGLLNSYIKKNLCKLNCNWYVLLDAASYVATNKLDLSTTEPDFVGVSFYKIFGYPTGLGALLVKNESAPVLTHKTYFGGGTVDVVLSDEDYHVKRQELHERFEDGTVPFLAIIALKHCFDTINLLIPKVINNDVMETICLHTFLLAKDLYTQMQALTHSNGQKAVVLYMDSDFTDIKIQGGTVTFNLVREDGSYIGYSEFQYMADLFDISVRTGCFCNSGSCQRHLNATNKEIKDMFKAGHKCGDEVDLISGKPTGAVRASFAYYNTLNDVDKLILMICRCFVKTKYKKPLRYMNNYENRSIEHPENHSALHNGTHNASNADHELPIQNGFDNDSKQEYNHYASVNNHNSNSNNLSIVDEISNGSVSFTENEEELNSLEWVNKSSNAPEAPPYFSSKIVLTEIAIFPIKSCGAFKTKSAWMIGPKGFVYDREWMIVKDNGVCMTQKHNSRMCMIRPRIDLKRSLLVLSFQGMDSISIPLDQPTSRISQCANVCQNKVCTDFVQGYDCGDEVADWISEALGMSFLRLVRQSAKDQRKSKSRKGEEDRKLLTLSNQAQFLMINKATVRWLRNKIMDDSFKDNVDQLTDRFRGNIIVDMAHELVEREWQRIVIGKHEFKVEGPCTRCQMICIDQDTGDKTVEPLRTISEQFGGKMRFGIYLSYVGTIDGSKDTLLNSSVPIRQIVSDDDISR